MASATRRAQKSTAEQRETKTISPRAMRIAAKVAPFDSIRFLASNCYGLFRLRTVLRASGIQTARRACGHVPRLILHSVPNTASGSRYRVRTGYGRHRASCGRHHLNALVRSAPARLRRFASGLRVLRFVRRTRGAPPQPKEDARDPQTPNSAHHAFSMPQARRAGENFGASLRGFTKNRGGDRVVDGERYNTVDDLRPFGSRVQ